MTADKHLFLLLAGFFLAVSAQAAPNMKDGMWEITTKVEMPGMPMAIPPNKHNQCMTSKEAVPQQPDKDSSQDCKMTNVKMDGDSVSWAMQCRSKEATMDGTGKVTYKGGSMDGVMSMNVKEGQQGTMQMTYRMSGRHIGPCK